MATGIGMGDGTGIINALILSWHCTVLYCDTLNNTTPNYSVWRYAALEMKLERLVGWLVGA